MVNLDYTGAAGENPSGGGFGSQAALVSVKIAPPRQA